MQYYWIAKPIYVRYIFTTYFLCYLFYKWILVDIKWFPLCQNLYLIICVLRVSQHPRTISLLTNDQQRTRRSVKARNAWLKDNYKRPFVQRAVSIRLSRGYGREGEERTKKKKEIRGTRVRKSKNIRKPSFRSLRSRKSLVALKVQ